MQELCRTFGAVFAALVSCAACAVTPTYTASDFANNPTRNSFLSFNRTPDKDRTVVLDVELDMQTSRVSCGAHALSSILNYWQSAPKASGQSLYLSVPPTNPDVGYSMGELIDIAHNHKLKAFGVRLNDDRVKVEINAGRPVIIPVQIPYVFLQSRTLFDPDFVPVGNLKNRFLNRLALVHQWTDTNLLDHYVLVVGFDDTKFVLLDPIMGYRTISAEKLSSYREPFENAAIVFSR